MRTVPLNSTRLIRPFHARFPQSFMPRQIPPKSLAGAAFQRSVRTFLIGCRLRYSGKKTGGSALPTTLAPQNGTATHRAPILAETALIFQPSFGILYLSLKPLIEGNTPQLHALHAVA